MQGEMQGEMQTRRDFIAAGAALAAGGTLEAVVSAESKKSFRLSYIFN